MTDSTRAQHLHDHRVNKTRGHEVRQIPRTCIECGQDARPRRDLSLAYNINALIDGRGKR